MFLSFFQFCYGTAISNFVTFSSYHIVRTRIAKVTNFFPFCTIGISMYQKRNLPYFVIPSTFSPQASSPLSHHRQTEGWTTFFTPCYLSSFFFPLSARGPTRRRNSTGLAKLWGGWPIEQVWLTSHESKTTQKNTTHLTNTITMVVEPPSPLAAWIWWIDAARGAGVLAHIFPRPV